MKTKNVALALVAIVFAVGSAVASFFAPENVFVRAKAFNQPTGATQCLNTGVTCEATGNLACQVQVEVQTGTDIASSSGIYKTYRPATECQTILFDNTATVKQSSLSINRLVAHE